MQKVFRILYLVFGLIGLAFFIVGAVFFAENWAFDQRSVQATGEIIRMERYWDGDGDARVWVRYRVGDQDYEQQLNTYSSSMREGDSLSIRYDPERPEQIRDGSWWIFPLVFGGIGVLFLLVVVILMLVRRRQKSARERLLTYGIPVTGRVQSVQRNGSMRVNGRNPYEVVCAWENPDDGKTYLFRSESLWFDPEPVLRERRMETMTIYIDRDQPKHYYMDITPLQDQVVAL